jgi:hypothetical protein
MMLPTKHANRHEKIQEPEVRETFRVFRVFRGQICPSGPNCHPFDSRQLALFAGRKFFAS